MLPIFFYFHFNIFKTQHHMTWYCRPTAEITTITRLQSIDLLQSRSWSTDNIYNVHMSIYTVSHSTVLLNDYYHIRCLIKYYLNPTNNRTLCISLCIYRLHPNCVPNYCLTYLSCIHSTPYHIIFHVFIMWLGNKILVTRYLQVKYILNIT